jgi:type II secretory pathway pseudopilin PulG
MPDRTLHLAPAAARWVIGGVFVSAAILKAWSIHDFARVTAFLLPEPVHGAATVLSLALTVPMFEGALGAWILITTDLRAGMYASIMVLAAFSAVLLRLALSPGAPSCGCLGSPGSGHGSVDAMIGLARNGALIWLACWALFRANPRPEPAIPRGRAAGFTLVETLVVVSVVTLLIALSLPALKGARDSARINARVQTIRQLDASLAAYTQDYRDGFPYFATIGDPYGLIVIRGFPMQGQYFQTQRWYWASAIYPEYYAAPRESIELPGTAEQLQQVLRRPPTIVASHYLTSSTIFARSRFWADDPGGSATWYQNQYFAPTRITDVAYPSLKGLLIADWGGHGGRPQGWGDDFPVPVAFGDGSARAVPQRDFDPTRAVTRPFGAGSIPVVSTIDGLDGRDF